MAQENDDSSSSPDTLYPDCPGNSELIGDAICDFTNNSADCGFDGGDCCECTCVDSNDNDNECGEGGTGFFCVDPDVAQNCGPTSSPTLSPTAGPTVEPYLDCVGYVPHVNDGYCDEVNNNVGCDFDGGDCCACTCADGPSHTCGQLGDGYDCKDPDVPSDCGTTPSPVAIPGHPDCSGYAYSYQDGYCDDSLNNADCGYDGGDCCRCTCRDYTVYDDYWYSSGCGVYGYDCQDPSASTECPTDPPTPSPALNTDYPECVGVIVYISDGYCDYSNNNAECDFDGGDCCVCTCVDGPIFTCGPYSCLDSSAECTTTTSSLSQYYYSYYDGSGIIIGDDGPYGYDGDLLSTPSPSPGDRGDGGTATASVEDSQSSLSEGSVIGAFFLTLLVFCCFGLLIGAVFFCAAKRCMASQSATHVSVALQSESSAASQAEHE